MRSQNAPVGSPKLFLTAQGVKRGGTPQKSAAAPHFACGHFALSPHHDRCALRRDASTRPSQNRSAQYGGYAPSPADDFAHSKRWKSSHRGGRIEVDAGRIESFEGARARNHGPGDRREKPRTLRWFERQQQAASKGLRRPRRENSPIFTANLELSASRFGSRPIV